MTNQPSHFCIRQVSKATQCFGVIFFSFLLHFSAASHSAEFLPAIAIEPLQLNEHNDIAPLVKLANSKMKDLYQVPLFIRVYKSLSINGVSSHAFALTPAPNFEMLLEQRKNFKQKDEFKKLQKKLNQHYTFGEATYLKAIRFDGANKPGSLFNTFLKVENEDMLLGHITALEEILTFETQKPIINVFRVEAGYSGYTHLVSINTKSNKSLGKTLDVLSSAGWRYSLKNDHSENDINSDIEIITSGLYEEVF